MNRVPGMAALGNRPVVLLGMVVVLPGRVLVLC